MEGVPRFSDDEMARRAAAVQGLMDAGGIDALLIFGHSGNRRHYQAHVHYLTNVAPFHECYLLFPLRGEPVLWVSHYNHHATAKALSQVPDVRRAGGDPAALIARELEQRGLGAGRIGLVGTLYYQIADAVRRALPSAAWEDLTGAYRALRACKSDEEIAFQRKAAAGCDAVMEAIAREARPGVREIDLAVLSEEVAWHEGCEPHFLYLNSTPMANSESCVPNQIPSARKLRAGDVMNTELTVSYGLYGAQLLRPFFLGEPTSRYADLYDVLATVHRRLASALRPGTTAMEIHELSGLIEERGYTSVDSVAHGFGVDILPPNVRSRGYPAPPPFTLEANMTVVLQPNPATPDEQAGMQLGEMGLVTDEGFESMHSLNAEVIRIG